MIVSSLLGAALLAHELLYLTRDGSEYLRRCFVPTLGLQLSARVHCLLHLVFMAACVWLTLWPASSAAHVCVLALLSAVIASYSLRLSNHLVLAWFMLVAMIAGDAAVAVGFSGEESRAATALAVQGLVVVTYALSFLHKLNRDFLSLDTSYASQFAAFVCWDRGVRRPAVIRLFQRYSVASTLAFELALPVLLLIPETRSFGLLAAVAFHFSLALLGIVNFSAVMYAGLAAFLPPALQQSWPPQLPASPPAVIAVACAVAVVMVWVFTPRRANRHLPYLHRRPAWVIQTAFGLLTAWFVLEIAHLIDASPPAAERYRLAEAAGLAPVVVLLLALYAANGLTPYLGVKTEFSMAMFSNLRCKRWNHLLFPERSRLRDAARYIVVDSIEGLPAADELGDDKAAMLALTALSRPSDFEYGPYFFFEALARVCAAAARPSEILVALRFGGAAYSLTARPRLAAAALRPDGFPAWPRVNRFPFVLPLDAAAPHSEQGAVLAADGRRQLF